MYDMKGRASFVKMVILTCGKGGEGVVLPVYTSAACQSSRDVTPGNGSGGYKTM